MLHTDDRLAGFLRDVGLLSRSQVDALWDSAAQTGETFYETLLASGYIPEDDVRRAQSKSIGVPFVTLTDGAISLDALSVLPEAFCRAHAIVPFRLDNNRLMLALLSLDTVEVVDALRLPYTVVPHLTDRQSIKRGLLYYQEILKERHAGHIAELAKAVMQTEDPEEIRYNAERLPVQQIVDALFAHALSQSASDIHFEPRQGGLVVRYRVGGRLYDALQLPLHTAASILARLKLLARLDLANTNSQEGRFRVALSYGKYPEEVTLRVATMPLAHDATQEKLVVRLAREKEGKSGFMLEPLGFHGSGLDALHQLLRAQSGMVLVCGMEGSGVTTLLYTLLDHRVDQTQSVMSIEDTTELHLPGVVQTQTDFERGVTPASILQSAQALDVDTLMVSSSDSTETIEAAATAANEGKFVLMHIPAYTAAEGLSGLVGVLPLRLLSSVVVGVVATRLVRRLCQRHTKTKLSREELEDFESRGADLSRVLAVLREEGRVKENTQWKDITFGRPRECPECESGYVGYIGVQEVAQMSRALKDVLFDGGQVEELEGQIRSVSLSLLEDGIYKAAIGLTSVEEVGTLGL